MKKVLFVLGEWGNGGIEKLIAVYCRELAHTDYKFDIFAYEINYSVYTEELKKMGIKILHPKDKITGDYVTKNKRKLAVLRNIVRNYDIVHYNTSFGLSYLFCYYIKKENQSVQIVLHSHGDNINAPYVVLKTIVHTICKTAFANHIDYAIACSMQAGEWLFTKKMIASGKYALLKNATGLECFEFSLRARKRIRNKFSIGQKFVVGTIGRFDYQKNPYFTLKIISGLHKLCDDFTFLWIGDGPERDNIVKNAKKKGLANHMIFITSTNNISEYLSAMDVFILPSRFEGLGIVLLEAQANGLFCFASDSITREARISGKIAYLGIAKTQVGRWVKSILRVKGLKNKRAFPKKEIMKQGYDMDAMTAKLKSIYDSFLNTT